MTHILLINDNNLMVQQPADRGGHVVQRSQGYALLDGNDVRFDLNSELAPVRQIHLKPQQIQSRYWQQCGENAIPANGAGLRHAADLIWRHLTEIKNAADFETVALVVPAHYQSDNLRLLLGIAKALGLSVTAVLSKPVVAARQIAQTLGRLVHIDVQLHQTVISTVQITEQKIELISSDTKADLSLHSLQDALLHILQQRFIQNDRFDPLHDAETEQQLFDQLPALVAAALKDESVPVGVQSKGRLHSTTLERGDVSAAFVSLRDTIESVSPVNVICDLNQGFDVSALPGLAQTRYPNLIHAGELPALKSAQLNTLNDQGEVIYRTSMRTRKRFQASVSAEGGAPPSKKDASIDESLATSKQHNTPKSDRLRDHLAVTHLLQFGQAVSISAAQISTDNAILTLKESVNQASDVNAMVSAGELQIVNDRNRQELQANDRLMSPVADGVITAISVRP